MVPTRRPARSRARRIVSDGSLVVCGGAVLLARLLPMPLADGTIDHLPSVCPFFRLTGLPCPGCGMTRSWVCLAHGNFAESIHYHPLGPALYAVAALIAVVGLTERILPIPQIAFPAALRKYAPIAAVAIVLTAWVFRLVGVDPLPRG